MKTGIKLLIRTCAVLLYLAFFLSVYLGLHVYLGNTITVQDHREYTETNRPDFFPILVTDIKESITQPILRSVHHDEYSSPLKNKSWNLYQQVESKSLPQTDKVHYEISQQPEKHLQVTIAIGEKNNQRISTYTYEIEAGRAKPRSYTLTSSFGKNFSPMPFLVILTGILIYLSEKFILKKLLNPSPR